MKSDDEMSKTHKQNKQFNKMKNIKRINKTTQTTTNSPYSNNFCNQNKYEFGTWTKPKFQQSLMLRIVEKLPQPSIHIHELFKLQ